MSATNLTQGINSTAASTPTETEVADALRSLLKDAAVHQYQWAQTGCLIILITAAALATVSTGCLLSLLTRTTEDAALLLSGVSLLFAIYSMTCACVPLTAFTSILWTQVHLIILRLHHKQPLRSKVESHIRRSTVMAYWLTTCMFPLSVVFLSCSVMTLTWSFHYALMQKHTNVFGIVSCTLLSAFVSGITLLVVYIDISCKLQTSFEGYSGQPNTYLSLTSTTIGRLVTTEVRNSDSSFHSSSSLTANAFALE